MVQISLEIDDLTNVRLVPPGPVLETVWAGRTLRPHAPYDAQRWQVQWRQGVAPRVARNGPVRRLLEVVSPRYEIVDLCLPSVGAGDLDDGLERLKQLGPAYYRLELGMNAAVRHLPRHVPRWTERLAEKDPRPRDELVDGVRRLHELGLRDGAAAAGADAAQRFIADRTKDLAAGGLSRMLDNLHPWIRWHAPVLTIDVPGDPPVHAPRPAGGRGLVLAPSIFATGVQYYFDGAQRLPSLLVFPIDPWTPYDRPARPKLDQLLGRKRAAMLIVLASADMCTSDLARSCGISASAASEHARVLREAGLVTTDRSRRAMHSITPAGTTLLGDNAHAQLPTQASGA
ncbi:winged helix-turn-helix domain-containing protein [Kribbella italica]